jgi:hypothetical protein
MKSNLLEDCREILVEFGFTERWSVIEKYWSIGKRICEEPDMKMKDVNKLAELLNEDEHEIKNAILFYKKFPDLNMLPEGKNVNWSMVKNKYL